ncbi:hypothetical protein F7725_001071 [Dissostichus mawsoni]|uniref:Uncharacterized protein n=1 Tax=Dissostichus mawsoni TaxID=36200 RepID=A0A7J5ZGQ8_DISMA|nr:hypothetical protein F7725_001071 [Dissostichus mawsoni]
MAVYIPDNFCMALCGLHDVMGGGLFPSLLQDASSPPYSHCFLFPDSEGKGLLGTRMERRLNSFGSQGVGVKPLRSAGLVALALKGLWVAGSDPRQA